MDMSTAVKTVLSKYVTFSGRASRSREFWWWVLATIIATASSPTRDRRCARLPARRDDEPPGRSSGILALALLLPGLAETVRRLHDIGRSRWWYFIVLIPLIGALILLYWHDQAERSRPEPLRL